MNPTSEAMADLRAHMQAKHTPGPWRAVADEQVPERGAVYVEGPEGWADHAICDCEYSQEGVERDEANARLIAAAPDMLKVLHAIANVNAKYGSSLDTDIVKGVHAAIAKAEGRS
jgi:hypothetical protein